MAYADSVRIEAEDIPVIDISGLRSKQPGAARMVAAEMLSAARHLGFFYVSGHGVPQDVIDAADREARAFFALPYTEKLAVSINERHRGFLRVGEARMEGNRLPDLKESFVWGLDVAEDDPAARDLSNPFIGPNNWPAGRPGMRSALIDYFNACNAVGFDLMRAFAIAMDIPEETFIRHTDRPISRGGAVFYPPQPDNLDRDQFGVGPHTDYGCLTVLHQDPIGGLEVRNKQGDWVIATPIEGTFVVNVGDLLARWTNDRFASTPHRVVNRSGRERLSLAVFVDPDFETMIDPRDIVAGSGDMVHYDPVRCGDYVLKRYDGAFSYRKKKQEITREVGFSPEAGGR